MDPILLGALAVALALWLAMLARAILARSAAALAIGLAGAGTAALVAIGVLGALLALEGASEVALGTGFLVILALMGLAPPPAGEGPP